MNIKEKYDNYGIMILENVFSKDELDSIFEELEWLYDNNMLLGPEQTGSGRNEDGSFKKKNIGIFLNELYIGDDKTSEILRISEEKLLSIETREMYSKINPFCRGILNINRFGSLLSYYEQDDTYGYHYDICAFTVLSYFYKEPKSFDGGELIFKIDEEEIVIDIENNTSIFFPAAYDHKVTEVKMKNKGQKMNGRFSLSQFLYIAPY